jgi:hypothetical protein
LFSILDSGHQGIFFLWLAFPFLVGSLGGVFIKTARRLFLIARSVTADGDVRPIVLYLRSHTMDRPMANLGRIFDIGYDRFYNEEEQLIEVLGEIGPVVALEIPGDYLPPLGARRIYPEKNNWKEEVKELMRNARLVVILFGTTEGVAWEIEYAQHTLEPNQLLFAYSASDFQTYSGLATRKRRSKRGVIGGFKYIQADGEPCWLPLQRPGLLRRAVFRPKVPAFQLTLQPVLKNVSIAFQPPRVRWINPLTFYVALSLVGIYASGILVLYNFSAIAPLVSWLIKIETSMDLYLPPIPR